MVFPAYAGMSLDTKCLTSQDHRFPRLRGDEPQASIDAKAAELFSPPTRG